MTTATPTLCKCGQQLSPNGLCHHCDRGACDRVHVAVTPLDVDGPHCQPKHDPKTCENCQALNAWEPWPGYNEGKNANTP